VLLIGVGGLGAEIAKNIVLAGVRSLTLLDDQNVCNWYYCVFYSCPFRVSTCSHCSYYLFSVQFASKNDCCMYISAIALKLKNFRCSFANL